MKTSFRERREFQRIPSHVRVRFYCNDIDYAGTISDISEKGMHIRTGEVSFPFESSLELFIRTKGVLLKVPVTVRRLTRSRNVFNGLGVQVMEPAHDYLSFVRALRKGRNSFSSRNRISVR